MGASGPPGYKYSLPGCMILAVITDIPSFLQEGRDFVYIHIYIYTHIIEKETEKERKKKYMKRYTVSLAIDKQKTLQSGYEKLWSELQISSQISAAFKGFWGLFQQCYFVQFYDFLFHLSRHFDRGKWLLPSVMYFIIWTQIIQACASFLWLLFLQF